MTKLEKEIRKDYIVVLLFVLASGCTLWISLIRPAGSFIMLLLGGYVNAKRTKNNKGNSSINYLYWIIFLCVLNLLIEQSPYQDNSMLGYLVSLTGAYLIISRYDYYYFVKILTDIIYYITLIGIPLYLLSTWELIPTFSFSTTNSFTYKYVLWYTIGWPDLFYRYSGIWHEPGACQIFLNTILWLNFDKIRRWTLTHKEKQQFIVIVIGLLLTQSTGGYLVFMIFIAALILTSKLKVRNKRIAGFSLFIIGILAIALIFMNPVIQNKIFEAEGVMVSKTDRLGDIAALWNMIIEKPILGYGIGTDGFWTQSHRYGNYTCSAGLLAYMASLGFPWLIVTAYFCYKNIKRLKLGMATYFLLASIVMMQMNEKFIEYPITSIFIFRFYSYNNYRRLWKYQLLQFVSIRRKR